MRNGLARAACQEAAAGAHFRPPPATDVAPRQPAPCRLVAQEQAAALQMGQQQCRELQLLQSLSKQAVEEKCSMATQLQAARARTAQLEALAEQQLLQQQEKQQGSQQRLNEWAGREPPWAYPHGISQAVYSGRRQAHTVVSLFAAGPTAPAPPAVPPPATQHAIPSTPRPHKTGMRQVWYVHLAHGPRLTINNENLIAKKWRLSSQAQHGNRHQLPQSKQTKARATEPAPKSLVDHGHTGSWSRRRPAASASSRRGIHCSSSSCRA